MTGKSIRVCSFTNLFPPVVSGSATQSFALARELANRGCQVVVITARVADSSPSFEVVDGVHIYRLPAIRLPALPIALNFPWLSITFTPSNLRRIAKILREYKPDIIHLHNHMLDLGFSALLMRRKFRIPVVISIHTVIKHARRAYNLFLYPADRLFLRYVIINRADAVICPDVNIQDYAREAFGERHPYLVPYGISPPEAPSTELLAQLKAKYKLEGKRIILSLGHLHEIRNRKDLVEALPEVLKVFPNTILVIVGVVATDSTEKIARALNLQDAVIFTGPVPHAEVSGFLKMADMEGHWLNQEAPEKTSLGIATLEAMAAGKATLTAANENTYGQGVIRNGENVILVDPGKPRELARTIIDLLKDEERREDIGEKAHATVETYFSWDSVCRRTLEVYSKTILAFKRRNSR